MERTYRKVVGVLAIAAFVAAGCGGDDDDDAAASDASTTAAPADDAAGSTTIVPTGDAPDEVSIQICGGVSTNFASFFVAEGTGLFDQIDDQFGTDISLDTSYGGGNECIAAFTGGQNDFTSMSPALSAVIAAQNEDVKTIMETFLGTTLVLVGATSEEASRGTDLSKWGGTSWATTGPGATTETVPKAMLIGAGVDESSLTFLPVGNLTAMTAALQTGQVDAVATVPAAAIQMIDAGIGYEIQTANDPAVIRPLVGDILGAQGLTTTQDFIDRYPELTQAIVDAIHEGLRKVQEAGANADAVLAMFPDDVVEQLGDGFAAQWAYTLPAFVDVDSVITASEAQATLDFQETYAGADFSSVPDTFFDNTYALQSYDDLGLDEPADIPQYPLQG